MKQIYIHITLLIGILIVAASCHAQRDSSPVFLPDIADGRLTAAGELRHARAAHTATLLENGSVLIVGGFAGDKVGISETEVFDSQRNAFLPGPTLAVGRSGHTATRLRDGRILIAGGYNGEYLDSSEIYDPKTAKIVPGPKLTMPRSEHVAVLLANGEVLLAGGVGTGWTFLAAAEIFDPSKNSFRKTGAMTIERESHTATLLKDGTVLITGGHRGRRSAVEIFSSAEIFDPKSGIFSRISNLTTKRHKHDAILLPDGRVIVAGGSDERDSRAPYTSVEVFDPTSKRFEAVGDLKAARYKHNGASVLLKNGKIVFAGGANRVEVFDPVTMNFGLVSGDLGEARFFSTSTLLNDGRVLIIGGYNARITASGKANIFRI